MDELSITVTIADRIYRLTIDKNEEEIVRKAARQIEERMREYAKTYAYKDKQDLLAMAALQFTTALLNKDTEKSRSDEGFSARLKVIEEVLDMEIGKQNVL
jgi:cell division protein ZapA (FtsZ GTPase activity inhibitor)